MALVLTEEQELLGRTARELVAARSPLKRIRQLRDARDPRSSFSEKNHTDLPSGLQSKAPSELLLGRRSYRQYVW